MWSRFLVARPTLSKQLSKNLVNEENEDKLRQLKTKYQALIPQCNRFNDVSDTVRTSLLILLNGVLSKHELQAGGSTVGDGIYSNMRQKREY